MNPAAPILERVIADPNIAPEYRAALRRVVCFACGGYCGTYDPRWRKCIACNGKGYTVVEKGVE